MNGDTSVLTSKPRDKVSQATRFIGKKISELMPIWLWRQNLSRTDVVHVLSSGVECSRCRT